MDFKRSSVRNPNISGKKRKKSQKRDNIDEGLPKDFLTAIRSHIEIGHEGLEVMKRQTDEIVGGNVPKTYGNNQHSVPIASSISSRRYFPPPTLSHPSVSHPEFSRSLPSSFASSFISTIPRPIGPDLGHSPHFPSTHSQFSLDPLSFDYIYDSPTALSVSIGGKSVYREQD
ncbi:hypothetical protein ADUPG1_005924, partial [Aduncisulcus paluster]